MLQPFAGIKVLDFSQGLAGPYAAGMLGAMGADVVKVEPPEGDWGRLMSVARNGSSAMGLPANLGKRSVCVDGRRSEGRDVLQQLAGQADVVIESFRPGVLSKLGLSYESLRRIRSDIVLASICGYGPSGPYASRPASDSIMQGLTGMAFMNQTADGASKRIGMLAVDMVAGLYSGFALSSAIFDQHMNGRGRHLQISLMQAATAFQMVPLLESVLQDGDRSTPTTVPSGFFLHAPVVLRSYACATKCLQRFAKRSGGLNGLTTTAFAQMPHAKPMPMPCMPNCARYWPMVKETIGSGGLTQPACSAARSTITRI